MRKVKKTMYDSMYDSMYEIKVNGFAIVALVTLILYGGFSLVMGAIKMYG